MALTQQLKTYPSLRVAAIGSAILLLSSLSGAAQHPPSQAEKDSLVKTIAGLDASLFEAYNHCDLEKLGALVADDLEFYHDQTGLAVGKAPFLQSIRTNICGKVARELVPGTLEVYPLKGYGAVEIGVHRFYHPGRETDGVGEAKFVTLWKNTDGTWKVSRVISYDHGPAGK